MIQTIVLCILVGRPLVPLTQIINLGLNGDEDGMQGQVSIKRLEIEIYNEDLLELYTDKPHRRYDTCRIRIILL